MVSEQIIAALVSLSFAGAVAFSIRQRLVMRKKRILLEEDSRRKEVIGILASNNRRHLDSLGILQDRAKMEIQLLQLLEYQAGKTGILPVSEIRALISSANAWTETLETAIAEMNNLNESGDDNSIIDIHSRLGNGDVVKSAAARIDSLCAKTGSWLQELGLIADKTVSAY